MSVSSVVYSTSHNPYDNLALEECLRTLLDSSPSPVQLYLWQNAHTVVCGRNQNPWRECHVELLRKDKGYLARRGSGGGAVFHDLGNLNFTFLVPTPLFDIHRQLSVIIDALKPLGIPASFSGRNDILAQGAKFSGTAYRKGRQSSYIHGTLLVDVDMAFMGRYLRASPEKLRSKGVSSVQSRVVNLKSLQESLTMEELRIALGKAFAREYSLPEEEPQILSSQDMHQLQGYSSLRERFGSREWLYGNTPDFDVVLRRRFDWGELELLLKSTRGNIESLAINTDALESQCLEELPQILQGCPFDFEAMQERMATAGHHREIREDAKIFREIGEWFLSEPLREKPSHREALLQNQEVT